MAIARAVPGRLARGRPGAGVTSRAGLPGVELVRDAGIEQRSVLTVDLEQDAGIRGTAQHPAEQPLVDAEVVDQEALAARDTQGGDAGEVAYRV